MIESFAESSYLSPLILDFNVSISELFSLIFINSLYLSYIFCLVSDKLSSNAETCFLNLSIYLERSSFF